MKKANLQELPLISGFGEPKSLRAGVPLRHTLRVSCVIQSRVIPWHHLRFQVFEGGGIHKTWDGMGSMDRPKNVVSERSLDLPEFVV